MTSLRDDTIGKLEHVWSSLSALGASLTPDEWRLPTDCPGWNVKDQFSHLIGTERSLAGLAPTDHVATFGPHVRNELGQRTEHEVDARRHLDGAAVLAEFDELVAQRRKQVNALTDEELAADSWTPLGPGTLLDFMQIRILDFWVHEQDVRRAVGRPGDLDGPVAEHTLDRLLRGLSMVVGKRVAPAADTSISFELTGPVRRAVTIGTLDGRAKPIEPPPGGSTASIAMDSESFLVLVCGRRTREQVAANVRVGGDQQLAENVLANLNTMI
jgi:uncharacterized protein (TIGR03083 family)